MTHPIERASVEQADIDLCSRIVDLIQGHKRGENTAKPICEMLAAHRQQAHAAGFAEGVERAAEVAEEFTPGGWHYERDDEACSMPGRIATAIRDVSRKGPIA